jgi:hypothetical protein
MDENGNVVYIAMIRMTVVDKNGTEGEPKVDENDTVVNISGIKMALQ